MNRLRIEIRSADGVVKAALDGNGRVGILFTEIYEAGDEIVLLSARESAYLVIQLEDAMNPAFVYLTGGEFRYPVPFGEKRASYSPKSFIGNVHVVTARMAEEHEIAAYKNVAKNEYDHHNNDSCFPHAQANVETRGESVFAARNAINGNALNDSHGQWPYESWGINQREDAELTVHFGRTVEIDKVVLTLRADFPHDNYWQQVTLAFSDGSRQTAALKKTADPQPIALERRKVEWVTLCELVRSSEPSPFPALSQIEVYGTETSS